MRTTIDLPDYPAISIDGGERCIAKVTVDTEGEVVTTLDAPVDFGDGALHVHLRKERIRAVYEFHAFRRHTLLLPFASWRSASFGRSLPLLQRHIRVEGDILFIEPPWPLDFVLRIEGIDRDVMDRIISSISSSDTASARW